MRRYGCECQRICHMKYITFPRLSHTIRNLIISVEFVVRKTPAEGRVVPLLLDEYPQTHNKVNVVVHSTIHTVFS